MIEPICECRSFGTHVEDGAKSTVREPGGHGVLMELLSDVVPGAVWDPKHPFAVEEQFGLRSQICMELYNKGK